MSAARKIAHMDARGSWPAIYGVLRWQKFAGSEVREVAFTVSSGTINYVFVAGLPGGER